MTDHTFDATLEAADRGGAYVVVPFDAREVFGSGRPRIVATFDGAPAGGYRGSLASMGGRHVLGVTKAIRTAIGKQPGDTVHVVLRLDDQPRTVDPPPELAAALDAAGPAARQAWEALSYTRRKELARAVASAKRPETRERRARKGVEALLD